MELLLLNDYYRKASLGNEYRELNIIYHEWYNDLHREGNYMSNDKLELISTEGIIRWYMNKFSPIDIDYNYYNILYYYNHPEHLTFYDFKCIQQMGDMNNIKSFDINVNETSKYIFIIKNKIDDKYILKPFGYYLCDKFGRDIIIKYMKDIYKTIATRRHYFDYGGIYDCLLNKYPQIKKWGIIYHKYKIILEKISLMKNPNIYIVDSFVEKVQQYIYTLIVKYIEQFRKNNNIHIKLIDEEQFDNDKYLYYYEDLNNFVL